MSNLLINIANDVYNKLKFFFLKTRSQSQKQYNIKMKIHNL